MKIAIIVITLLWSISSFANTSCEELMGNWTMTTAGYDLKMFTGRHVGNISFGYDEEENIVVFNLDTYHQKWNGDVIPDEKDAFAVVRPLPEKIILDGSFHEMTNNFSKDIEQYSASCADDTLLINIIDKNNIVSTIIFKNIDGQIHVAHKEFNMFSIFSEKGILEPLEKNEVKEDVVDGNRETESAFNGQHLLDGTPPVSKDLKREIIRLN